MPLATNASSRSRTNNCYTDYMTQFYFVRHAETEMNVQPDIIGGRSNQTPLTPRGKRQAALFGEWLGAQEDIKPDIVYVSPAIRTRDTAHIILEHSQLEGIPYRIDERLQELSQGIKEGASRNATYTDTVRQLIAENPLGFKFEGGESIEEVMRRMYAALSSFHALHGGKTILVVSHGFAIRSLVGHIEQREHDDIVFGMKTPNVSVTHITINENLPKVHTIGHDVAKVELVA